MGTRHLIAVQLDGQYKIAQYGQWDGDPRVQGRGVLEFLHSADLEAFKDKVRSLRFLTDSEIDTISAYIATEGRKGRWPELSRDAGADILRIVLEEPKGIRLVNSIDFAGDSVFCEWAYVVDFDAGTFEVFKGFNEEPLAEGERFANIKRDSPKFYPVKLAGKWPLEALPTVEEFMSHFYGRS